MESFSEAKQMARVNAGLTGGPFFKDPVTHNGKMTFVNGWPAETTAQLKGDKAPQSTPTDPWMERRSK